MLKKWEVNMMKSIYPILKPLKKVPVVSDQFSPLIQIVLVEPREKPYKLFIPNTFEAFQDTVHGYIEHILIEEKTGGKRIVIILNECGKLLGFPFNRKIGNFEVIMGTFFITSINTNGEYISLTNTESDYYISRFSSNQVYLQSI